MPPKPKASKSQTQKSIETFTHDEATRTNIPTAEHQSVMKMEDKTPIQVAYDRRSQNKDPQLVWRGKDVYSYADLVVSAPPLYIQEKVHPKVLIEDLKQQSWERETATQAQQLDLFADFNGFPKDARATEFYQHQGHWTNRMILGDGLQVMLLCRNGKVYGERCNVFILIRPTGLSLILIFNGQRRAVM